MATNYNELNFNKDEMTLDERYAAITGIQIFDLQEAVNNAPDKQAMIDKLVWQIWNGTKVADNDIFTDLVDEIKALGGDESSDNVSSSDEGSSDEGSSDEGSSEEDSSKENDNDNNDEGSSDNEPDVELNVDEPKQPINEPTVEPTNEPTVEPTVKPDVEPDVEPTNEPESPSTVTTEP